MKTESGFPKKVKGATHLLKLLYNMKAYREPVALHRNMEPETGSLHSAMWDLKNAGDIEIIQIEVLKPHRQGSDVLFKVRLKLLAYERIRNRRTTIYMAYLSLLGAVVSIVSLIWTMYLK